MNVNGENEKIEFWIPRDKNINVPEYTLVNMSSLNSTVLNQATPFMSFQFQIINLSSYSLHVQLKPGNKNISYLVLLRFGNASKLNENQQSYDLSEIVCPNDLINDTNNNLNESYYMIFANMNKTNGFNGLVYISIRELDSNETSYLCNQTETIQEPPISSYDYLNFTNNFYLRVYSSGCYYYDTKTNLWSSEGVDVLEQGTNEQYTHCESKHLTEFAGGFIVIPTEINFDYVWANASFLQNPIIYSTVIALCILYLLLAILLRYYDLLDKKKVGITYLDTMTPYNNNNGEVFYEITLYTGNRTDSGTDSRVFIKLYGLKNETETLELKDKKRKCFNRSSIDTFIISMSSDPRIYLDDLLYLRIWHDNSGKQNPSWYLKHIIIRELHSVNNSKSKNKTFYFINEKWLAIDKDDCKIERLLACCGDKQINDFKYLLKSKTKQNLSDNHLWYSLMARPVYSSFTRLDRLTCCFVLLNMTMLLNILYYDYNSDNSNNSANGLIVGPFSLTPEQVKIDFFFAKVIFIKYILILLSSGWHWNHIKCNFILAKFNLNSAI